MKARLLGGTALIGAAACFLGVGTAEAAVAPMWRLAGNMNFQFYWIDQDWVGLESSFGFTGWWWSGVTSPADATAAGPQEHGWYFGVDEAELRLDVSGTADNGLNFGFKIELNANTTDRQVADEARIELSGSWGTLLLGDDDGAENVMNFGGENLMGATGGFDGDLDDYLFRAGWTVSGHTFDGGGPAFPIIAGDSGDATKISYFSPRFSGFQIGASFAPTPNKGDEFKSDGDWEDHYGIGVNYDNSFGKLRIAASAVYSATTSNIVVPGYWEGTRVEDVSAWSLGAIIGWGPFSIAGNYTDNGESGYWAGTGVESSYWNAAAALEFGRVRVAAGYFESVREWNVPGTDESSFSHFALTADYSAAPGLAFYAQYSAIEDMLYDDYSTNKATAVIVGARVSF